MGLFDRFKKQEGAAAQQEKGVVGTTVIGGFITETEKNAALTGDTRYETAADILNNLSIVASSLRYFLNLLAHPTWSVEPADDSDEAEELAEYVEKCMETTDGSWARLVRKAGMYRFYGFANLEITTRIGDDGYHYPKKIRSRPQFTIYRWDMDDHGNIQGVWQRSPKTGEEIFIPRWKMIYIVDDQFTDNPEGIGWYRNLAEPAARLKEYLRLEKLGFSRDLSGIPVGRAPLAALNKAVKSGQITAEEKSSMITTFQNFVEMEVKQKDTGILLDSQPFTDTTADGPRNSGTRMWDIDLLTGDPGSIRELGEAIRRINVEIARIIGTENVFTGTEGIGSMALSRDKSSALYLQVSATLKEIVDSFNKDLISLLWSLNGFPEELKPKLKTEQVAFKDVEVISRVLRDMAKAGATLAPDDDAINDVRDLLDISKQDMDNIMSRLKPQGNKGGSTGENGASESEDEGPSD